MTITIDQARIDVPINQPEVRMTAISNQRIFARHQAAGSLPCYIEQW